MNFLIVTGLSGAGKSMAVNALEDIGFFCIDNIPVALLPRIVDFALQGETSSAVWRSSWMCAACAALSSSRRLLRIWTRKDRL